MIRIYIEIFIKVILKIIQLKIKNLIKISKLLKLRIYLCQIKRQYLTKDNKSLSMQKTKKNILTCYAQTLYNKIII